MWHRLNSYKTTLQYHDESHSNSSSSHVQLELYNASGKLRSTIVILRWLQLRFDLDSTVVRLPIKGH